MAGREYDMPQLDGNLADFADDDTITGSSIARTEPFSTSTVAAIASDTTMTYGDESQNGIAQGGSKRRNVVNGINGLTRGRQSSELPSRPSTSGSMVGEDQLDLLGRDVRRMMDTISRLRLLGFETSVVNLPKIVVIGDQSTGKSSVIEAISDIKVPRSVGTCTRCPLEVNLSHSEKRWSCKVFLSKKFAHNANARSITKANKYGPWDEMDTPEIFEFAVLEDKGKVAAALQAAQRAILNPGINWKLFRPDSNEMRSHNSNEVEFSPNVVRMDISGPGIPNLCFYDLPGLISHVGDDGSKYLVKLVDNLAIEYMKAEDTLILLTLTMNHDVQNSKAAGMLQKHRADDRTLGVFTKPDLMSSEAKAQFLSVFSGDAFKRKLGYFAVKNNPDPMVGHAIARKEEKTFFTQWIHKYPHLSAHKHRFGTESLTKELSKQLVQRIAASLPKIRDIVEQKVEDLETKLEELPKPPAGNFSLEISNCLGNLGQDIRSMFNPYSEEFDFFQAWSKLNDTFCRNLTTTHPKLTLTTDNSLEATSRSPGVLATRATQEVIELDDDEASVTPSARATPNPQQRRKRALSQTGTTLNKRRRTDGKTPTQQSQKVWTLAQIRELVGRKKNETGLKSLDDPRVAKDIYSQSIGHWEGILTGYLNAIGLACGRAVMNSVRTAFTKQRDTKLWETVQNSSRAFLVSAFADHKLFAKRCLDMSKTMYTLNDVASGLIKATALRNLREARVDERVRQEAELGDWPEQQLQRKLAAAKKDMDTDPDEYDAEIQQMATVRGYYDYAATRLAENVALSFRTEVFAKIREQLTQHLTKELRLDQEDANKHLGGLLTMDPAVANERARCESELERLRAGLQQLDELEQSSSVDSADFESMSMQSTVL